jgi:hypothetical protein
MDWKEKLSIDKFVAESMEEEDHLRLPNASFVLHCIVQAERHTNKAQKIVRDAFLQRMRDLLV